MALFPYSGTDAGWKNKIQGSVAEDGQAGLSARKQEGYEQTYDRGPAPAAGASPFCKDQKDRMQDTRMGRPLWEKRNFPGI